MESDNSAALRARISELEAELAALRAASAGRDCAYCGKPFHSHNATARTCSTRCRVALHRAPKRRAATKIWNAYITKFGGLGMMEIRAREFALMNKSLRTGKDEFVEQRQKQAEWEATWEQREAQRLAEREAYNKTHPFTADEEARYTSLVKERRLYEGACDLRWADYFAFRQAHKCEPLTADDESYLGQWTTCPT
jgi:predicted nucleic acid-binding Zn ribbon protein